jgi:hypothetical protein
MRFSTVFVASTLALSGFAVAQRGFEDDLYARSFDADALDELYARSFDATDALNELVARAFEDEDVGLYLRSLFSGNATQNAIVTPSTGLPKQPSNTLPTNGKPPSLTTSGSEKDISRSDPKSGDHKRKNDWKHEEDVDDHGSKKPKYEDGEKDAKHKKKHRPGKKEKKEKKLLKKIGNGKKKLEMEEKEVETEEKELKTEEKMLGTEEKELKTEEKELETVEDLDKDEKKLRKEKKKLRKEGRVHRRTDDHGHGNRESDDDDSRRRHPRSWF